MSDLASAFHLNNSQLTVLVHWAGKGSQVVLCLARDQEMIPGAQSSLYLSKDSGKTFEDISDRFQVQNKNGSTSNGVLEKINSHPDSACRYVFTDTINKYIFTTADCGQTVTARKLDSTMTPSKIVFDKRVDNTFLVHDLESDDKELHVTRNFGETFSTVSYYVKTFFLKYESDHTQIILQRFQPPKEGGDSLSKTTILSSPNYFERTIDTEVLFRDCVEFQMHGQFMFVTTSSPDQPGHLDLRISADGERFVIAEFDLGPSFKISPT